MLSKQFGNSLITLLLLFSVISASMQSVLTRLYENEKAIRSFKLGVENKKTMNAALSELEKQKLINPKGSHHYKQHHYRYQLEKMSSALTKITMDESTELSMQSIVLNGNRISLYISHQD